MRVVYSLDERQNTLGSENMYNKNGWVSAVAVVRRRASGGDWLAASLGLVRVTFELEDGQLEV